MKFIEDMAASYMADSTLLGISVRNLLNKATIHLCPMVNPDGVDLVTGNLPSNSSAFLSAKQIADSYVAIPFPDGWKANLNGVDLKTYQPDCNSLQLADCKVLPEPPVCFADSPLE